MIETALSIGLNLYIGIGLLFFLTPPDPFWGVLLLLCRAYRNKDCCTNQESCSEILYKGKSVPSHLGLYIESFGPIIQIYASSWFAADLLINLVFCLIHKIPIQWQKIVLYLNWWILNYIGVWFLKQKTKKLQNTCLFPAWCVYISLYIMAYALPKSFLWIS